MSVPSGGGQGGGGAKKGGALDAGVTRATAMKELRDVDWASFAPKSVPFEDSVLPHSVNNYWERIYAEVGADDEKKHVEVRLALYAYCAKNGTSREGNYEGVMKTASGMTVPADVLPRVVTKYLIRRFMRACAEESYLSLKLSGCLLADERFIARIMANGVPTDAYMATCDWLRESAMLTPQEAHHNERLFVARRKAADVARGGTLDSVEARRVENAVGVHDEGADRDNGTVVW